MDLDEIQAILTQVVPLASALAGRSCTAHRWPAGGSASIEYSQPSPAQPSTHNPQHPPTHPPPPQQVGEYFSKAGGSAANTTRGLAGFGVRAKLLGVRGFDEWGE